MHVILKYNKICYSSIIYFSLKSMCDSVMLVIYFGLCP